MNGSVALRRFPSLVVHWTESLNSSTLSTLEACTSLKNVLSGTVTGWGWNWPRTISSTMSPRAA